MFLINTVLIILLVGSHVSSEDLDVSFKNFQLQHQKTYQTDEELELREGVFNSNKLKIQEHNKRYEQGLETYTMGVNQFTDLTEEEFAAWLNGSLLQWPQIVAREASRNELVGEIPEGIDWREKGVVTSVKNQGDCGGCWAYSATGTLEAQLALKTGELISLSEQELLDCSDSNLGCDGGVVQYAYDYVIDSGLSSAENYPSIGVEGSCKRKKHKAVRMEDYYSITPYNETELKQAVGLVGPVSVAINAFPLQTYAGGIFNSPCASDLNHAVLAVGYGKNNETGEEYWIMKNSWGTSWGESGYFKMSLGEGLCGVALQACYPLKVTSSSDTILPKFYINVFIIFVVLLRFV